MKWIGFLFFKPCMAFGDKGLDTFYHLKVLKFRPVTQTLYVTILLMYSMLRHTP